ncbi:MAG: SH3 domain-containing protein [Scytolyngbya sp. HA4215-MV1]|nr:SH3 domain-containing protein [Scytolyngbya sp. HA4215-MV1]
MSGFWRGTIVIGFSLSHLLGLTTAQAAYDPNTPLNPVPANACQHTYFYQVKKTLTVRKLDGTSRSVVPATTVLLPAGTGPDKSVPIALPGGFEGYISDRDFQTSLTRFQFGSRFEGKMRVKTLDPGGSVNLRKEPTRVGKPEQLVVGTLRDGDEVRVRGMAPGSTLMDSPYYYVLSDKGLRGFIATPYLVCVGENQESKLPSAIRNQATLPRSFCGDRPALDRLTWYPVLLTETSVDSARTRYCGNAASTTYKGQPAVQLAVFTDQGNAATFARTVNGIVGQAQETPAPDSKKVWRCFCTVGEECGKTRQYPNSFSYGSFTKPQIPGYECAPY